MAAIIPAQRLLNERFGMGPSDVSSQVEVTTMTSPCEFTSMSWELILPASAGIMTVDQVCHYIEDARNIAFHGWSSDGAPLVKCWLTPDNAHQFVRQTKIRRPDELVLEVISSRKVCNRAKSRRYQYLEKLIDFNCELDLEVCQCHGENRHFKILFRDKVMRKLTAIPCEMCEPHCGNVTFIDSDK